jgi:acyl-CoA synthetase (AMP-forming)/AMP-acid ligase II
MSSAISPLADQRHTPATPENAVSASSGGEGKDVNLAVLNPRTIDEMMRYRARLTPNLPLVSYPSSGIDYVNYTSLQLDIFAFRAAKHYALHIPSRSSSIEKPKVIGLLGPSDFNYIITMLSLWKLGHTILLLSTRIAKEAHISLLKATGAKDLLFHESTNRMASRLCGELPYLRIQKFISQSVYNYALENEPIDTSINLSLDFDTESGYLACIIHSSGSTGLPKPVYFPQNVIVKVSGSNMNMKGYTCAPFYHAFGVGTLLRAIHSGKQLYIYNAALPLTRQYLIGTMRTHDFEIFYCVPYALKLLAESAEGVKFLASSKIVMFAGSACPDSLGNRLTECGVKLVSDYGS